MDKVENTDDRSPRFNKGVRDLNTAFLGGYLWEKGNKFEILQYYRREDKFLRGGYGGDRYAFWNSMSAKYALIS